GLRHVDVELEAGKAERVGGREQVWREHHAELRRERAKLEVLANARQHAAGVVGDPGREPRHHEIVAIGGGGPRPSGRGRAGAGRAPRAGDEAWPSVGSRASACQRERGGTPPAWWSTPRSSSTMPARSRE